MRARLSWIKARLRWRRRLMRAARTRAGRVTSATAALLVVSAGVAFGCGWVGTEHSVRFNAWLSEAQFSRLPPLPFTARGPKTANEYEAGEAAGRRRQSAGAVWAEAERAAAAGDLTRVSTSLGEYLKLTAGPDCGLSYSEPDCLARRRSAFDQLDALASHGGAGSAAVVAYLEARRAYDAWRPEPDSGREEDSAERGRRAEEVRALLGRVARGVGLDDNVAYLLAGVTAREGSADTDEAAHAFEAVAVKFPRSEKREAALFSAAMLHLRASRGGLNGSDAAADEAGSYATTGEVGPHLRDRDWTEAARLFRRVLREHARGRYAADARGWLAYLHLRAGETAEGLAEYYRALADAPDDAARAEALRSLRLVRPVATGDDLARLESLLEGEPRAALAYAYHSVYNFALRGGLDVEVEDEENPYHYCRGTGGCAKEFYSWEAAERRRRLESAEQRELARVAEFAARMMRRHGSAGYGAGFAVRVAAVKLELGESGAARELARRSLAARPASDDERAAALWVRGVAEYRLRDYASARRTLAGLAEEFPHGDFAEGARRYVALAAEDAGDLEGALEQYLALDYEADAAYFLDVLMTPEQVAAFVERRPDHPRSDVLLYSLAVRYMRLHRFEEARAVFARVRTSAPKGHGGYNYPGLCPDLYERPAPATFRCLDPKEPDEEMPGVVLARWVARDLRTMEEIESRERAVEQATGDEAKAEALYQLAGYYYGASELIFYNPAAWRGGRFYALYYDHEMRAPDEPRLLRRYMEEHERLAHALDLYLRVTREYPRTRAARDALYTAAVIHERLEGFLLYWPDQYKLGLQAGERMVTYADVRRTYPGYQLPRGTTRWEPATRTVGGGPGWAAPPPRERATPVERLRRRLRRAEAHAAEGWALFGEIGGGRVRRWSLVLLFSGGALLLLRLTRRSRTLLLDLFVRGARRRERGAAGFLCVPASSYGARQAHTASARAGAAAARAWRALREVALDERGRVALVLNLFTHGLLTALVYAAAWALRSG
jgi:TolA-binding protein